MAIARTIGSRCSPGSASWLLQLVPINTRHVVTVPSRLSRSKLAMVAKEKTEKYYSAHNFASKVSFGAVCDHYCVVRIFVGLVVLAATMKVEEGTRAMAANGKTKTACISTTKASFSTMFGSVHDSDHDGIVRIIVGHS